MSAYGDEQLAEQGRRPMQLPAGVPIGAFLSFRDLRSVHTSRLVADTLPQLIAGIPQSTLALRRVHRRGRLPLHVAAMEHASAAVVTALLKAHPEGAKVKDGFGKLPLYLAMNASPEVVRLLRHSLRGARWRLNVKAIELLLEDGEGGRLIPMKAFSDTRCHYLSSVSESSSNNFCLQVNVECSAGNWLPRG